MIHLFIKDMKLMQPLMIVGSLLIGGLFSIIISITDLVAFKYGLLIFLITYMAFGNVEARNNKNMGDMVLFSLPVNKSHVLLSKYLSCFVFFIYSTIIVFASCNLFAMVNNGRMKVEVLGIESILIAFDFLLVYASIYIPLSFKYGYRKVNVFNGWIYLGFYVWTFTVIRNASTYYNIVRFWISNMSIITLILTLLYVATAFGAYRKSGSYRVLY